MPAVCFQKTRQIHYLPSVWYLRIIARARTLAIMESPVTDQAAGLNLQKDTSCHHHSKRIGENVVPNGTIPTSPANIDIATKAKIPLMNPKWTSVAKYVLQIRKRNTAKFATGFSVAAVAAIQSVAWLLMIALLRL
jgi:hypothetical protein